jgi:eukaryotic-like serine/threonine-protein kinase
MIGEKLGDYEITGSLGKGGFGTVYKAKGEEDRDVAIKVLNTQALGNARVVKKFFHEAMILARLDHPNITRLMEFFPDGDSYALVMEYVKGVELKDIIKKYKGPLPFDKGLRIAKQAADAFQYAHENGILHRDIKPGNILITEGTEDVKVMDFGIAKMSSTASHDTAASMLSIHYVPPERFDKSRDIDVRSDIYSLGLVFYEIFAGRRPFTATETSQIMFSHLNQIPDPPSKHVEHLPPQISDAIAKSLEKDPDDRFNDFREFYNALEDIDQADFDDATAFVDPDATLIDASLSITDYKSDEPEEDPEKRLVDLDKKKRNPVLIIAIVALVLIAGGIGGFFAMQSKKAPAPVTSTTVPVVQKVAETPPAPAPVVKVVEGTENSKGYGEIEHPADKSKMVVIPDGEFTMGSESYTAEKPIQKITLSKYYIDKYLVTNAMFTRFTEETGYQTDAEKEGAGLVRVGRRWKKVEGASWKSPDGLGTLDGREDHPVSQVSHNDSLAYCNWAKKSLPTEAQWERAARGPEGTEYPWGDSEPNDTTANFDNFVGETTPVTEYEKGQSFYGVQDMAGNVYQWCLDWYATGQRSDKDPKGPETGTENVIKGGSFIEGMESLRSANRDRYEPNYSSFLFGFRCACEEY